MNRPFLFEFMDLKWIPESLRATVHDVLDCVLSRPFRSYYDWVVEEIERLVEQEGFSVVTETGAGTAPLAQRLALNVSPRRPLQIEINDLHPDREHYLDLQAKFPTVRASLEPVDLTQPLPLRRDRLLVMSGCFHHLPAALRPHVLRTLRGHRVAVFEPLRCSLGAVALAIPGILPALLAPGFQWGKRPGNCRRVLWCWLLPAAPLIIVWDGILSSLRCWTDKEWRKHLSDAGVDSSSIQIKELAVSQSVAW